MDPNADAGAANPATQTSQPAAAQLSAQQPQQQAGDAPEQRRRVLTSDLPEEVLLDKLRHVEERGRRTAREELLKELGIEDLAAFKKERTDLSTKVKTYEEAEEKRKRETMTREEQLSADLDREKKLRAADQQRIRDLEEEQMSVQQQQVVERIAVRHVDPEMISDATERFRKYIYDLEKKEPGRLDTLTERDVDKFFRQLVAKIPKFAKDESTPSTPADKTAPKPPTSSSNAPVRPVIRKPLTNGAPPPRQAAPNIKAPNNDPSLRNGKTFRPNQPNSMNKQEMNAELAKMGINRW